jgi:serine protease AprX
MLIKGRYKILPIARRLRADTQYTGKGITIAFIDSGFYPHPDLTEPTNRILELVDITNPEAGPEDFLRPQVLSWHGMMTSVCCAGNGYLSEGYYKGLAPDAQVVLIKVMREGGRIEDENIYRGIEWAIANKDKHNIKILNISLGGNGQEGSRGDQINSAVEQAVQAGMVVVVAVGNTGANQIKPPASAPSAITVGGLDDKNTLQQEKYDMYWSSYGATSDGLHKPEIIAPAIWIALPILPGTDQFEEAALIDLLDGTRDQKRLREILAEHYVKVRLTPEVVGMSVRCIRRALNFRREENKYIAAHYKHGDGTSFAAPIVASIVAQMLEANPDLTPKQVKRILMKTAHRLPHVPAEQQGCGVVSQRRALRMAES